MRENQRLEKRFAGYIIAGLGVGLLTAVIQGLHLDISAANVPILYLFAVTLSALAFGRGAAIWASGCSFLAINWLFATPGYTFTVQEPTEWMSLCMFLFTAIVTGQLMALLKARAFEARQHQREATALSEASWAIASQLDTNSALLEVAKQVAKVVDAQQATVVSLTEGAGIAKQTLDARTWLVERSPWCPASWQSTSLALHFLTRLAQLLKWMLLRIRRLCCRRPL